MAQRRCTRTGCARSAVATLTYIYSDSTAVVGPLAAFAEPHSYDLCEEHAVRLTAPRGWEVMRHEGEFPAPIPYADDIEALAQAVREAARIDHVWDEMPLPAAGGRGRSCSVTQCRAASCRRYPRRGRGHGSAPWPGIQP